MSLTTSTYQMTFYYVTPKRQIHQKASVNFVFDRVNHQLKKVVLLR